MHECASGFESLHRDQAIVMELAYMLRLERSAHED